MPLINRAGVWYWRESYRPDVAKMVGMPQNSMKSLKTKDKAEAEQIVKDQRLDITHKRRLMAVKWSLTGGLDTNNWQRRWFPKDGLYQIEERQVMASGDKLMFLRKDGTIWKTFDNKYLPTLGTILHLAVGMDQTPPDVSVYYRKHFSKKAIDASDFNKQIFNAWLQKSKPSENLVRDAKTVLNAYTAKFPNLKFKDCTKAQARQFLQDYMDLGLASATIQKKIGFLKAAINVAIQDETMTTNPFSNLMKKAKTENPRLPFSDDDMKIMLEKAPTELTPEDLILFTLLHKTGMRMDEAYSIETTDIEEGIRYAVVGRKTLSSKRRVPFPDECPDINGPYISGGSAAASKRINRFINACGITDTAKVAHSFRHRAQDRLRILGAPDAVRHQLLGHSDVTVGDSYGLGFPVRILKPYIDQI